VILEIAVRIYFVNVIVITVEPVVVKFVVHPQRNKDSACNAYGKAKDIGKRKASVSQKISPGNFQIVPDHGSRLVLYSSFSQWMCQYVKPLLARASSGC